MPWNLFLFPLVGGFLFLHRCHFYRFRSSRLESERLLLNSASTGTLLLLIARGLTLTAKHLAWGRWLRWAIDQAVPNRDAPYLGTALVALLLGMILSLLINFIILALGEKRSKLFLSQRYDDGLQSFMVGAMFNNLPVLLTLDTRKVYIGYVQQMPDVPHDPYFSLILLLSGHRDKESMQYKSDINYVDQMKEDDQFAFTITLSLRNVVSANIFDRDVYEDRFAPKLLSGQI
jgi:hypothetical protein